MTFHGITASPYGPLMAFSAPDGTVRVAVLVWREGGKQPDGSLAHARWEAVNAGTIKPTEVWPDLAPPVPVDPPVVADETERVGTWLPSGYWQCLCPKFPFGNECNPSNPRCGGCHAARPAPTAD